jgi:heme exporter protein D
MMGIDLGTHAGFIIAAYAVFVVVTLGVIVWVMLDGAAQRKALAELEARGVRRRSDPAEAADAKASPTVSEGVA